MASGYVTELAAAVDSIGGKGRTGEPYVTPMRPKPAAKNLATLEEWLRKELGENGRHYMSWVGHKNLLGYYVSYWACKGRTELHSMAAGGADSEHEARVKSAIEAVAAILKEKAKES